MFKSLSWLELIYSLSVRINICLQQESDCGPPFLQANALPIGLSWLELRIAVAELFKVYKIFKIQLNTTDSFAG